VLKQNPLGAFLRDRRAKLDPAALGLASGRRRTPGLRREEVAQRANISTTWYICLEQGRGGPPSSHVLDRIARALMLTDAEREHLYLIALGRPPELHYKSDQGIEPRLQRILDALNPAPALIKTATWDVVAWNAAAAAVFIDYGSFAPEQRNLLRLLFLNPGARRVQNDWEGGARAAVAAFRADVTKAGAVEQVGALVDELSSISPDFRAMWRDNDVLVRAGTIKHVRHLILGPVSFECSTLAVDGRQDLAMIVYFPTQQSVARKIGDLIAAAERREERHHSGSFADEIVMSGGSVRRG
jgi:transcriptional regulator with XRE-family HTH domain